MRLKKLVWHIFPANLLVTIGSLLAILWFSSAALDTFYGNWLAADLEDRAYFIEEQVSAFVSNNKIEELNNFCRRIGRKTSTRITVIKPSGAVIADSDENSKKMNNHGDRPEIKSAMNGEIGSKLRFSSTMGGDRLYVAIPLSLNGFSREISKFHVLRMSMPASAIDQALKRLRLEVAVSSIIVALLAMFAAIIVSRRISQPLERITEGVEQLAQENFNTSLTISNNCSFEVGTLVTAMNSMAQKLRDRFGTIVRQRNELQTILASMAEAVFVIDNDKNIKTINNSACHLFGVSIDRAVGRSTEEIVRNLEIAKVVGITLAAKRSVTEDITLDQGGEKLFLQYSGVRLYDDTGNSFGAVIAFTDVTNIRRLENIRRDFVANVSHELMTPLTSIKGYTETIIDSGKADEAQTLKFLQIILRQSDRLQDIVNDLLELSRIENEIEQSAVNLVPTNIKSMLDEAIQVCSHRATEKDMTIELECSSDLTAPLNGQLMEQAVVNLLVNAIKYSEPESRVEIKAYLQPDEKDKNMLAITVQDYGMGIGQEHLPRLFERFYRSDKARSRKLGGTGLGLAIVKHIVQAHEGNVSVDSVVGQGTIFTILIPPESI